MDPQCCQVGIHACCRYVLCPGSTGATSPLQPLVGTGELSDSFIPLLLQTWCMFFVWFWMHLSTSRSTREGGLTFHTERVL